MSHVDEALRFLGYATERLQSAGEDPEANRTFGDIVCAISQLKLVEYTLTCRGCGTKSPATRNEDDVVDQAIDAGWKAEGHNEDDRDLCPSCQKAAVPDPRDVALGEILKIVQRSSHSVEMREDIRTIIERLGNIHLEAVVIDGQVPQGIHLEAVMFGGVKFVREDPRDAFDKPVMIRPCDACGGVTLNPQSDTCECGSELFPVSKKMQPGSRITLDTKIDGAPAIRRSNVSPQGDMPLTSPKPSKHLEYYVRIKPEVGKPFVMNARVYEADVPDILQFNTSHGVQALVQFDPVPAVPRAPWVFPAECNTAKKRCFNREGCSTMQACMYPADSAATVTALFGKISAALSSLQIEEPRLANPAFDALYELRRRNEAQPDFTLKSDIRGNREVRISKGGVLIHACNHGPIELEVKAGEVYQVDAAATIGEPVGPTTTIEIPEEEPITSERICDMMQNPSEKHAKLALLWIDRNGGLDNDVLHAALADTFYRIEKRSPSADMLKWLHGLEASLEKTLSMRITDEERDALTKRRGIYAGIADDIERKWALTEPNQVEKMFANMIGGPSPLCFHAAKGKRCTRYLEGVRAERRDVARKTGLATPKEMACKKGLHTNGGTCTECGWSDPVSAQLTCPTCKVERIFSRRTGECSICHTYVSQAMDLHAHERVGRGATTTTTLEWSLEMVGGGDRADAPDVRTIFTVGVQSFDIFRMEASDEEALPLGRFYFNMFLAALANAGVTPG